MNGEQLENIGRVVEALNRGGDVLSRGPVRFVGGMDVFAGNERVGVIRYEPERYHGTEWQFSPLTPSAPPDPAP